MSELVELDDLCVRAQRARRNVERIQADLVTRTCDLNAKLDRFVELVAVMGLLREEVSLSRDAAAG